MISKIKGNYKILQNPVPILIDFDYSKVIGKAEFVKLKNGYTYFDINFIDDKYLKYELKESYIEKGVKELISLSV